MSSRCWCEILLIRVYGFTYTSPVSTYLAQTRSSITVAKRVMAMVMVMKGAVMAMCAAMLMLGLAVESQAQCADLTKLYACLPAARADVKPTDACCQAVAAFNSDAGIAYVCSASADPRFTSVGGKPQFGILIPQKCNLRYKAGTKCNGVVIPGGQ